MSPKNSTLLNELSRVEKLIEDYQYRYRTGIYRNKRMLHINLVHSVKTELSKLNPDRNILKIFYNKLKECD